MIYHLGTCYLWKMQVIFWQDIYTISTIVFGFNIALSATKATSCSEIKTEKTVRLVSVYDLTRARVCFKKGAISIPSGTYALLSSWYTEIACSLFELANNVLVLSCQKTLFHIRRVRWYSWQFGKFLNKTSINLTGVFPLSARKCFHPIRMFNLHQCNS